MIPAFVIWTRERIIPASSSLAWSEASQATGRGFNPHRPLQLLQRVSGICRARHCTAWRGIGAEWVRRTFSSITARGRRIRLHDMLGLGFESARVPFAFAWLGNGGDQFRTAAASEAGRAERLLQGVRSLTPTPLPGGIIRPCTRPTT